jgi:hypothetical protein
MGLTAEVTRILEVAAKSHRARIIPDSAQLEMIRGEGCIRRMFDLLQPAPNA